MPEGDAPEPGGGAPAVDSLPLGVAKEVVQEAAPEHWRRPKAGDRATVHYTGRLKDADGEQFDSSRGQPPVSFKVGSGEVIKGWELALPTMRQGEVSRFTIAPEYAYGERGMAPKIPPSATLVFEIELVSWTSKDDLFGDWGCARTTLEEGCGWREAEATSEVELSLRAVAADGRVLEERGHVAYRLGSGELGQLSRVIDRALTGARRGARLLLRCQKDYAFGDESHGEVSVELELHETYEEEDASFAKDKSVMKKKVREGVETDTPDDAAIVRITVESASAKFGGPHACFAGPQDLEFVAGDGQVCDAIEQAVLQMAPGERAVVTCSEPAMCAEPRLGLGTLCEADGEVVFTLELTSFDNPPRPQSLSEEGKVAWATQRKEVGSRLVREARYLLARQRYKGAVELLSHTDNFKEATKSAAIALKLTCELNSAQCFLKMSDFFGARSACDAVLKLEPNNVKALFRRATANMQLNEFEGAVSELRRLLGVDPNNAEARRMLPQAQRGVKDADKRAKSMYSKMSRAITGAPPKAEGSAGVSPVPAEEPVKAVRFAFEEKPEAYSPIYLESPARRTAAVNAGDYRLYVGGGAINKAFGELFKETQGLRFRYASDEYQDLHVALLKSSRERGHVLASAAEVPEAALLLETLQLAASIGRAGPAAEGDTEPYEGSTESVFIDVFREEKRPLHERNVAMVYVVGPKGEACAAPKMEGSGPRVAEDAFLASIERLAASAVATVGEYNRRRSELGEDLPPVEELRWCLVSGGVYRHDDVSKVDVAAATLRGMRSVKDTDLLVTFTYDDDAFRLAAEQHPALARNPNNQKA